MNIINLKILIYAMKSPCLYNYLNKTQNLMDLNPKDTIDSIHAIETFMFNLFI